ncbi:hypothetical protein QBC35DRAFT_38817 [Podospora australis]|uniref:Uncharacterized protein n=1 Tax=Podospora australis TaxID=1536484 RepID=A0AAN6WP30_9PEZI|nr:hypothetical protein QBC35DRAFT_38817 [Podospora australis]
MQLTAIFLGLLFGVCSAAPAPQKDAPILTLGPLPDICSIGAAKPSCFTHTTTVTPKPRTTKCPVPSDPIMCPMIVRITTIEVPCPNACCPKTATKTVTAKAPGCVTGCVIPTITETVTPTYCAKNPPPTLPTAILTVG